MTDRSIQTGDGDAMLDPTPMSRAEAAAAFVPLLVSHEPFFDHEVQRPQGRMRVKGYTAAIEAPDILVSAARAVVFKGARVVVLTESDGVRHVMPGGRREAGESQEATVRRELLEECGWHVGALRRFAFLHFQNAEPSSPPDGHDFVNVIYLAECAEYDRRRRDRSQGEVRSRLISVRAAFSTLADRHRQILAAALSARRTLPS